MILIRQNVGPCRLIPLSLSLRFTRSAVPGYYDIALRDFGLLLGALTLARLATLFPAWPATFNTPR